MQIEDKLTKLSKVRDIQSGSPSGAAQFFIPLDEEWGIKFQKPIDYHQTVQTPRMIEVNRARAQAAYDRQKEAAEVGLAPEAGEVVELKIGDVVYNGYTTRIARTFHHVKEDVAKALNVNVNHVAWYQVSDHPIGQEYINFYRKHQNDLLHNLKELTGQVYSDMKPENAGIIDGKLVAIDFGDEGLSDFYPNYL